MVKLKKTVSTIFLLPTLKIPKEDIKKNGFINAYSFDSEKEIQYEDCIYVLFKPDDLDYFRDFLERERERTSNIVEDYDYEDGFIVVVYKLNPEFKRDFNLVRKGKYSKTSKRYKELFPKTVLVESGNFTKNETSLQHRIFDRSFDLIEFWETKLAMRFTDDMELWEGFHAEKETLIINKIREYEKII
jgi:hypothetical protein